VTLDLKSERGEPLDRQRFTWRDLVRAPVSKLDDDAFTRGRVILLNAIESDALRLSHACNRNHRLLRRSLVELRRIEQHQQTMIGWLLPADQSPLETTIAYEQVAIEVTAALAQHEPDPYLAQVLRFGLLEDFDHLYRYAALLDRLEGKDANNILQSYTDVRPGRPTIDQHRAPTDDLRRAYDRTRAAPVSKLNNITVVACEYQTRDYYMHVGPLFADPAARLVYAEIASIEEQHVTQYECLADPDETWLEKWLLHEAAEVYNYWSCALAESDPQLKRLWERFVAYELGHVHLVAELLERTEARDPWAIIPATLPDAIDFSSHREFVRRVLADEVDLRAHGTDIVPRDREPEGSKLYRAQLNADGSPTQLVAASYRWVAGTELTEQADAAGQITESLSS
jgi:hypothetical protein